MLSITPVLLHCKSIRNGIAKLWQVEKIDHGTTWIEYNVYWERERPSGSVFGYDRYFHDIDKANAYYEKIQ